MQLRLIKKISPTLIALICSTSLLAFYNLYLVKELQANTYAQTKVIYNQDSSPGTELVTLITNAHSYAYFAVYTFTKSDIADALIAAKLRGLDVRGVLDYNQSLIDSEKVIIKKLEKYNIPLEIPVKQNGLMHIKLLVTDGGYASGSFNWTSSATYDNDEVLEIGSVQSIHDQYEAIIKSIFSRYASSLQTDTK